MNDLQNRVTGAFVEAYDPLSVWMYDPSPFPANVLNPLARVLLQGDSRYSEGNHLFVRTDDRSEADLLLFPCDVNWFEGWEDELYNYIEFFAGNESRHLFFDHRDACVIEPAIAILLKASVHRRQVSDRVHCIPYLDVVDDFFGYLHQPRTIDYELSFVGEESELRSRLLPRLERIVQPTHFRLRRSFYHLGHLLSPKVTRPREDLSPEAKRERRREYIDVALRSRFILCPPGYGLNTFRFFEALSLGIPPVHIGDDCALPWADLIDYSRFTIQVELGDEETLAERIAAAIADVDDERYREMCKLARLHYDSYLSPHNFLYLLHRALKQSLRAALNERTLSCSE
jgi:hypothetical protein